jgi:cytochrome c553
LGRYCRLVRSLAAEAAAAAAASDGENLRAAAACARVHAKSELGGLGSERAGLVGD